MKNLIKLCLVITGCIFLLKAIGREEKNFGKQNTCAQDTTFLKNYIAANVAYLYTRPNLTSKTKIRIPKNVMITTIRRSGNFEYGHFSISSTKTYKGWFLLSDLQGIFFAPPKTN